jgi:hypothetical protein
MRMTPRRSVLPHPSIPAPKEVPSECAQSHIYDPLWRGLTGVVPYELRSPRNPRRRRALSASSPRWAALQRQSYLTWSVVPAVTGDSPECDLSSTHVVHEHLGRYDPERLRPMTAARLPRCQYRGIHTRTAPWARALGKQSQAHAPSASRHSSGPDNTWISCEAPF